MLIVLAAACFNCQKEISEAFMFSTQLNNELSPIITTLQGNVLDETGRPAQNVVITVGANITTTNSNGYFRITDATLDKNTTVVTAQVPGYFKAYRTFRATGGVNQVLIQLVKKTLTGTINATTGGEIKLPNGAVVKLEANGVTSHAGAYSGDVNIFAAYIAPAAANIQSTIPGALMGDDKQNQRVVLESYGMLAVELESPSGEKLKIGNGSFATLTTPIPASLAAAAPTSIPLWYLDEITGVWKEEGSAEKKGNAYIGAVKHFSYWNCDIGLPAISFNASFEFASGATLNYQSVLIRLADGNANGYAYGYTDSLGQLSGLIPANKNLVLEIADQCGNIVYSKNIGPFNQNTDLGTLTISSSLTSLVTLKGKLVSCSNAPVTNGYVLISRNNMLSYVKTGASGEFVAEFLVCISVPEQVEITGLDISAFQQGSPLMVPLSSNTINAGNIVACGTSSLEFINYTVDAIDYSFNNIAIDSIYSYSQIDANNFANSTMYAYRIGSSQHIQFDFNGIAQVGSHALKLQQVNAFDRIGLINPVNINITSFAGSVGSFHEGSFTGTFKDSTNLTLTHSVTCSFRVRRMY